MIAWIVMWDYKSFAEKYQLFTVGIIVMWIGRRIGRWKIGVAVFTFTGILLSIAILYDWKYYRIPNWLIGIGLAGSFVYQILANGGHGILSFFIGVLVCFLIMFPLFFALIAEEGFLISPCYSLELCIQMLISFLFSFAFRFSSFHSYL